MVHLISSTDEAILKYKYEMLVKIKLFVCTLSYSTNGGRTFLCPTKALEVHHALTCKRGIVI